MFSPLIFQPVYKDYIWGSNRIPKTFKRDVPDGRYAESWEVSEHQDGMSVVESGPFAGWTLRKLFTTYKKELMGKDAHLDQFPLLIKLIDAKENLSVQVHPDDQAAARFGGEAKTEAWVVLDALPQAVVYAGLKQAFPKEVILEKLPSEEILSLLRTVPIQEDQTIFIPGGRLHAIGAGAMVLEVQQTSNTTYRVYDFGRGRELHLEAAKKVLHYDDYTNPLIPKTMLKQTESYTRWEMLRTPYFVIEKWELYKDIPWNQLEDAFEILFLLKGSTSVVPLGRTLFLPAQCSPVTIETSGATLFRIYMP